MKYKIGDRVWVKYRNHLEGEDNRRSPVIYIGPSLVLGVHNFGEGWFYATRLAFDPYSKGASSCECTVYEEDVIYEI